jgi:hypothetical protein
MSTYLNKLLFLLLMLLVVASPLPLGSNREWSWSLCALVVALITLAWVVVNISRNAPLTTRLP